MHLTVLFTFRLKAIEDYYLINVYKKVYQMSNIHDLIYIFETYIIERKIKSIACE